MTNWQLPAHGLAISYLPQKLHEHHQPTKRCDRSLGLAQFNFFSAPKSGNFPVHCFVLLGVSFNQLKLNRVRAKQCYSISEFRLICRFGLFGLKSQRAEAAAILTHTLLPDPFADQARSDGTAKDSAREVARAYQQAIDVGGAEYGKVIGRIGPQACPRFCDACIREARRKLDGG